MTMLEALSSKSRLPDGWSTPEVVADVVVADGVTIHRAGISSVAPTGEEITGSAADVREPPGPRSVFELLERAATVEALRDQRPRYELRTLDGSAAGDCARRDLFPESNNPDRWRYARSNGIAIHDDWRSAAQRALWELAERDRVLRSWYGEITPERLDIDPSSTALASAETYDWRAYAFRDGPHGIAPEVHVVGVFGFPRREAVPLVLGYGARDDEASALATAFREAVQLLGFLWGEPVTTQPPPVGPTAMHHLEHFQFAGHHSHLRGWLDGEHRAFATNRPHAASRREDIRFADLTPPWLAGAMCVAKAYCPSATPLAFGDAPSASHLPVELRVHPIA